MIKEKVRATQEIYWNTLPDNQEESYLYLCFLVYYLKENPNLKWIVTADIEKETDGFINNIKLGRVISALPTSVEVKKTTRYNKANGKSEFIYAWNPEPLINILLDWAIEPVTKEQLKKPNILKELHFLGKENSTDVFLYNHYKTFCLSLLPNILSLPEKEVIYLDKLWKERYDKSYQHNNSFVRSLINYAPSQQNKRIGQDCLVINHTNEDGYAWLSRGLINEMGFLFNKDMKQDYLQTRLLSRLVAMVRYPFEDWRYHEAPFKIEAHHTCKTRNCVNPAHLILSFKPNHQDYHRAVGDDKHPTIANDFEICPEVSVA